MLGSPTANDDDDEDVFFRVLYGNVQVTRNNLGLRESKTEMQL
jgi:hypothetical protein